MTDKTTKRIGMTVAALLLGLLALGPAAAKAEESLAAAQHELAVPDFTFHDGKTVPGLKLHYQTLGTPHRDARGEIDNAVLLLHGTGGEGSDFLMESFAGPMFGKGEPLDASKYFIILPDSVGHGKSSKPSDGLRMGFPAYDYADMVALQHRIVHDELGVKTLRLILGTSMGCMHSYVWGVTYPEEMRALMAMSCSPFPVAGMNWTWRKGMIDTIMSDPQWAGGNYTSPPPLAMQAISLFSAIAVSGAPNFAKAYPTQGDVDAMLQKRGAAVAKLADANDTIYQFSASRGYDAWAKIDAIKVPVLWWDSADDFINPPTLPYPTMALEKMKNFRYRLLPASAETTGHMSFLQARFFAGDVQDLLARSEK